MESDLKATERRDVGVCHKELEQTIIPAAIVTWLCVDETNW